jgi:uncharacterized protein YkwD
MRQIFLLFVIVFSFVSYVCAEPADAPKDQTVPVTELEQQEAKFLEMLNTFRELIGVEQVEPHQGLMSGARVWAKAYGKGHARSGYHGECIAPTGNAVEAFRSWYRSDDHRHIMEGASFRYSGIGFGEGRAVLRFYNGEDSQQATVKYTTKSRKRGLRSLFR